jgi:hypothetical protein
VCQAPREPDSSQSEKMRTQTAAGRLSKSGPLPPISSRILWFMPHRRRRLRFALAISTALRVAAFLRGQRFRGGSLPTFLSIYLSIYLSIFIYLYIYLLLSLSLPLSGIPWYLLFRAGSLLDHLHSRFAEQWSDCLWAPQCSATSWGHVIGSAPSSCRIPARPIDLLLRLVAHLGEHPVNLADSPQCNDLRYDSHQTMQNHAE